MVSSAALPLQRWLSQTARGQLPRRVLDRLLQTPLGQCLQVARGTHISGGCQYWQRTNTSAKAWATFLRRAVNIGHSPQQRWKRMWEQIMRIQSQGQGRFGHLLGNGPVFFSLVVPAAVPDGQEKKKKKHQPTPPGGFVKAVDDQDPLSLMPHVDGFWMFLHMLRLTALFLPTAFVGLLCLLRIVPQKWLYNCLSFSLVKAGPTFIKLGQWIATRPDLFSEGLCQHLGQLHTDSPSHPFSATNITLQSELGPNYMSEYFESIDEKALHSGCIAQVHLAKLKPHLLPAPPVVELTFFQRLYQTIFGAPPTEKPEPPSNEVVVKVVHPGLRPLVACDLAVLQLGMWVLSRLVPGSEWFQMEDALDNFSYTLTEHLDMRREAKHLTKFNELFASDPDVTFPKPVPQLVKPSVLVETFEQGTLISEWIPKASEAEKVQVAKMGLRGFLEMLFHHNYIHADLHPGNIIVGKKKDGTPRLVFLDAGMVTILTDKQWVNFVDLYASVIAGDGNAAADLMVDRAPRQECVDREGFRRTMGKIIDEYNTAASASKIHVGMTLVTILNTVRKYNVGLESDFASLVVSIIIVDGLGRSLQPDIDLVSASRPFVVQWLLDHPSAVSALIPKILRHHDKK